MGDSDGGGNKKTEIELHQIRIITTLSINNIAAEHVLVEDSGGVIDASSANKNKLANNGGASILREKHCSYRKASS